MNRIISLPLPEQHTLLPLPHLTHLPTLIPPSTLTPTCTYTPLLSAASPSLHLLYRPVPIT